MSAPLVPSPLDFVGRQKFSFYPPIRNADPNEWRLGAGYWSEVQVVNAHTGLEISIPRRYVGGVSDGNGSRLVVELTKELDYGRWGVSPRVKRVIEMPQPGSFFDASPRKQRDNGGPAPVVGIKLESEISSKENLLVKVLLVALALSLVAALLATIARLYPAPVEAQPAVAADTT